MRAPGRDGLRGGFEFNDKTPRGTGYREGVWRGPQWLWVEAGVEWIKPLDITVLARVFIVSTFL